MLESKQIIEKFLSLPVSSADGVFAMFEKLPAAVAGRGAQPLERFVYIPGARKDRILLVAHADTVWDRAWGNPKENSFIFEDGIYRGTNPECGIGADDRAGCAMVWALRDSGHSLLIVDGEEKGKRGVRFLRQSYPGIFRELNRHRFMMEMDWAGSGGCLYNQVDNTERFKTYIAETLGFQDSKKKGGCDLQILCQRICGVNIGVGWHGCHTPGEMLDLAQWENTYHALSAFLEQEHPQFRVSLGARLKKLLRRLKSGMGSLLRKLRLLPGVS